MLSALVAAAPTAGVLILVPQGFSLSISQVYVATREALEDETLVEVAPLDLFSSTMRQDMVRSCATDADCFLGLVQESRMSIDELLIVSLSRLDDTLLVAARWLNVAQRRQPKAHALESSPGRPLVETMKAVLSKVVPSGAWGFVAAVRAESEPSGAVATLRDRSCVTPCVFSRLAPGSYEVSFALEAHQRAVAQVLQP